MTFTIYTASTPVFVRVLNNLSGILSKAESYAAAKKIDPSVLVGARLYPDMYPLSRQVQIACDVVKGCVARLGGIELPSFPDTETTFAQLQERIQKTMAFVQSIGAEKINGSETKPIKFTLGNHKEMSFTGQSYLFDFVLPNLYFHTSMAYAILRHNGLDIGKNDFLGSIQ